MPLQPSEEGCARAAILQIFRNPVQCKHHPMERFHLYILENPEGQFYTGHTQNLKQRVLDHNRINSTRKKLRCNRLKQLIQDC